MPYHAKRICEHPGCNKTYFGKCAYCEDHKSLHNKDIRYNMYSRDMDKRAFYTSAKWLKIRALQLAKHPLCARHERIGKVVKATMVHHEDGNCYNNAEDNLKSLCNSCHSTVHKGDNIDDDQFYSSTLIDKID